MFGWAFISLFASLLLIVLGLSGFAGSMSYTLIALAVILFVAALVFVSKRRSRLTSCFIYPTWSCKA